MTYEKGGCDFIIDEKRNTFFGSGIKTGWQTPLDKRWPVQFGAQVTETIKGFRCCPETLGFTGTPGRI
jgi:hypothetical protein